MNVSELPEGRNLGPADEISEALYRLSRVTMLEGMECFRFFDIIEGADRSGRVFFQNQPDPSIPVVDLGERSFSALAVELFRHIPQARYSPEEHSDPDAIKGWDFKEAMIGGQPALVAWATWIITKRSHL